MIDLPVIFALRLTVVVATLIAWRRPPLARALAFAGSAVASTLVAVAALSILRGGPAVRGVLLAHEASGFAIAYDAGPLSAWFLLVLSVLAIPTAVFTIGYARHGRLNERSTFLGVTFNVLLASVELVFVADSVIAFLFAWEVMTLATAALVATEHEIASTRRAAFLYLVMSHVGTGCLIAAFFTLAAAAGSLSFSTLVAGNALTGPVRDVVFVLFLLGFGVKAGIIPLHIWLPEAHPAAPSSISALMSGVLIKAGIFGIVRFCAFGLGTPALSWGVVVTAVGALSAVLGVLYALMQHDLKRLLAYHSIENIGIILLGLGAGMIAVTLNRSDLATIGVAASLYHVLNHAVFKGLLFLSAGAVVTAAGTRNIEAMGGLLRVMPWTGGFFLVGALAISGFPPLNGFASEWLTFQAFLYGFRALPDPFVHSVFPVAAALLALTSALAAACFVKAFGITFLALPRSPAAADAREVSAIMILPQAFLAVLCLLLGLFPGAVLHVLNTVVGSLGSVASRTDVVRGPLVIAVPESFDQLAPATIGVVLLVSLVAIRLVTVRRSTAVRQAPTWGCGGELNARTEYTATAFSKPVMMIFRALYRPARQVEAMADVSPYFTTEVRYRTEIEPTFERYLYTPLTRGVLRIADRMKILQAGSLHAYLAYVIALVLTLVLFVWWTS
jgi:hydrogenase-4 component B